MPSTVTCEYCGAVVERKSPQQRFCCDKCRYLWSYYQRDRLSPEYRAANNERCRKWYAEHRSEHIAKVAARKRTAKVAELPPSKRKGEEPDAWLLPAPELDYLPGGAFTLDLRPRHKFPHHQLSALHGMVTTITGPHHPNKPQFALIPWDCGCGWAVYVADLDVARMVAGKAHGVRFNGGNATLRCGPMVRIKAPRVATGIHRLRIEAITPVHVRCENNTVLRLVPTAANLRGTLDGFLPKRLGVTVDPGQTVVRVIEDCTRTERTRINGRASFEGTPGWVGHVIVETNAVGRWLFECAALGLGYGGKVAFGFGRIRVTDVRAEQHSGAA